MSEARVLPDKPSAAVKEPVLDVLERMMEDCKVLCKENDPVLQGQMQIILGILADILEVKDPHHHFEHVVEWE